MKKSTLVAILLYLLPFSSLLTAHPGIGIVMDSQGMVYYTDLTHVWKISPDGSHAIAVRDVHTHQLYLDEEDNLYGEHVWYEGEATDKWGHYIWRLNNDGELEHTVPPTEGFPLNNTLIRDRDNNEYWPEKSGEHEILKKKSSHGTIATATHHRFRDIRWICVSKDGKDLYVIDHLTLKKVTSDGEVVTISDTLKEPAPPFASVGDHHYLMGAWTDTEENVYVAVFGAGKVKKITPAGKVETVIAVSGSWSPAGGLVAADGSLWVLEFSEQSEARVQKISPDGEVQTFRS